MHIRIDVVLGESVIYQYSAEGVLVPESSNLGETFNAPKIDSREFLRDVKTWTEDGRENLAKSKRANRVRKHAKAVV